MRHFGFDVFNVESGVLGRVSIYIVHLWLSERYYIGSIGLLIQRIGHIQIQITKSLEIIIGTLSGAVSQYRLT